VARIRLLANRWKKIAELLAKPFDDRSRLSIKHRGDWPIRDAQKAFLLASCLKLRVYWLWKSRIEATGADSHGPTHQRSSPETPRSMK
jgi:hypothetical protein